MEAWLLWLAAIGTIGNSLAALGVGLRPACRRANSRRRA